MDERLAGQAFWSFVSDIDVSYRKINPIWEFICYISVTGNAQDRLTISTKTGRRINCGWNLNDIDCENVIEVMRKLTIQVNSES